MSAEQVEQVGAFMQFGCALYEQQESGLGMAIVKQLVELYGGEFIIPSEPDRGTQVCVKLPAKAAN